jgi:predicted RNA-binding protein with PIN domain
VARRYLVDGTNVMGSRPDGWWRDRPAARRRLVGAIGRWARDGGDDVTVVFDGRAHELEAADRVTVLWATRPGRDAADDDIARLAAADPDPSSLTVVTSDAALARRVQAAGAVVQGAGAFRRVVD